VATVRELLNTDFGGHRIVNPKAIGSGGMADVYEGVNSSTGKPVAIKVLKPEYRDGTRHYSVRAESGIHAALSVGAHPNLLRHVASGDHYIVTDLLRGVDLLTFVEFGGSFTPQKVLELMLQICRGLSVIHRHGMVHRDLKPDNIFLTNLGPAKILDFGLTREFAASGEADDGSIAGTPSYMSPEQIRGETLDARSDLYAFGCLLYFVLTGEELHPSSKFDKIISMMQGHEHELPQDTRLEGVDTRVRRLLESLVRYDRSRRPASTEVVAGIIQGILNEPEAAPLVLIYEGPYTGTDAGTAQTSQPLHTNMGPSPVIEPVTAVPALPAPTPPLKWMMGSFLLASILTTTVLFGGYTALTFTRTQQPVQVRVVRDTTPPPARVPTAEIEIRAEPPPRSEPPSQCWAPRGAARRLAFVRIGDVKAAADARCWDQIPVQRRQRQCSHLRRRGYTSAPRFDSYCNGF
jgi:serine/threonine-protein kinase